jgi:hypothetical protein
LEIWELKYVSTEEIQTYWVNQVSRLRTILAKFVQVCLQASKILILFLDWCLKPTLAVFQQYRGVILFHFFIKKLTLDIEIYQWQI